MRFVGDNQKTHSGRLKKLLAVPHEVGVVRRAEIIFSSRMFLEVGLADVHTNQNIAASARFFDKTLDIRSVRFRQSKKLL